VLYYLGEQLGRGAYGVVYKAIEISTGYFVAVKQIPIEHMGPSDREAVRNEIELLSKLNHFNIVKYSTVLHDERHISIVTEFMESGSLAGIVRRFGPLPETLIAWYVSQALKGLAYLHEQGVIHRDIKGANILLNKRAFVKLADFGVATKLIRSDTDHMWSVSSESSGSTAIPSVVGSPYWMAPEIIEMSGYGTASDIWSIGCTVIELFTGYPPYYELAPMSALFRIVSDEHPPLPPNVSDGMADFLLQCFQKDAERRPSAEMLLRHPWLVKRTSELKRAETRLMGASSDSDEQELPTAYLSRRRGRSRRRRHLRSSATVQAVQEPILQPPVQPPKPVEVSTAEPEALAVEELDDVPAAEDLDEEQLDLEDELDVTALEKDEDKESLVCQPTSSNGQVTEKPVQPRAASGGKVTDSKRQQLHDKSLKTPEPGHGASPKLAPKPHLPSNEEKEDSHISITTSNASYPTVRPETLALFAEESETFDDLGIEDEDWLIDELQKWRHALHSVGFSTTVEMPSSDEADSDNDEAVIPAADGKWAGAASPFPGSATADTGMRPSTSTQAWHHPIRPSPPVSLLSSPSFSSAESDMETLSYSTTPGGVDGADAFEHPTSSPALDRSGDATALRRNRKKELKSRHSDSLPRDRYERLVWEEIARKVSALVRADLTLVDSKQRAVEAASSVLELFREVRHQRLHLVTHHLLIPLMEVLDASGINEQALVERVLEFLNEAAASTAATITPSADDRLFRDHLSIAGIVPILVEFSTRAYNDRVRLQAAHLLAKMLNIDTESDGLSTYATDPLGMASDEIHERRILPFTNEQRENDASSNAEDHDLGFIETFIASRGLRALVYLLEADFERYREMMLIALRGVALVMRTERQRRRHDICRLLARDGFLDRLSEALEWCIEWLAKKRAVNQTKPPEDVESPSKQRQNRLIREEHVDRLAQRLVELWLLFPPADSVIEKHMARRSVLRPIVHILPALRDRRDQMNVLNSLRDLSGHQESHRALQTSGAIPVLVGMLDGSILLDGRIMITLFNLCRLRGPLETRERQEEAVCAHDGKFVRYLLRLARSGGASTTHHTVEATNDNSKKELQDLAIADATDGVHHAMADPAQGTLGPATEHPLRGFAIEILCALDCSSEQIRNMFWRHRVMEFLIGELLGSIVHWHRLHAPMQLGTLQDGSLRTLSKQQNLEDTVEETLSNSLAQTSLHAERTTHTSSQRSNKAHDVRFPHLYTAQQKAILESLVTWVHASQGSLHQIEDILVSAASSSPMESGQSPAYLSVLAELPFCTAETSSPTAAESCSPVTGKSPQRLAIQSRNLTASPTEYILGPYRELIETSVRFKRALSAYGNGVFCRRLARLALSAKKADVRRQALLMLSALMEQADPEVLTMLQQLAAAERSVLLQPEVQSILERFGYALATTSAAASQMSSADSAPSAPKTEASTQSHG
jgi:serine/threonine protein kinase